MIHRKQYIVDLVEICKLKKIKHVVISPGSRNAELIRLFASDGFFNTSSVVDERSAAFYALGMARYIQHSVILVCTSGTAVLNYAPAIAEAYYQHIPLIVITADRPAELIDIQDNQTIRQENIYRNYIKESLNIPEQINSCTALHKIHRWINHTINSASENNKGPVHINIRIDEPLYGELPAPTKEIPYSNLEVLTQDKLDIGLKTIWKSGKKKLILCGEHMYNRELNDILNEIADKKIATVLAEPISNVRGKNIISPLDRIMLKTEDSDNDSYIPDVLISMGGQVVSKRLKSWLRKIKKIEHWRIAEGDENIDTYHNLTGTIRGSLTEILNELKENSENPSEGYSELWQEAYEITGKKSQKFFQNIPFSDLSVFKTILENLPGNCHLHLGNSSVVRYAQLFNLNKCKQVHSNRGVSGIDGSVSTASGYASVCKEMNIVITGDLSFVYDSNALWNKKLSSGLRVIVINNQGGGIFRMLSGPSDYNCFEEYQEAYHPADIQKLTEAFNLTYYFSNNENNLVQVFKDFINSGNKAAVLEIKTPKKINPEIYHDYINYLKRNE